MKPRWVIIGNIFLCLFVLALMFASLWWGMINTPERQLRAGRYQEAADRYREMIEKLPRPLQNKMADGIVTSMQMDLENVMLYHNYGKALLLSGNAQEALVAYTKFQELTAAVLGIAHYSRGSALIQLGQYAGAMEAFDAAIALAPDLYDAYQNRCATFRLMERYQDAVEACQDTIRRYPQVAKSHLSLGWAYELGGRPDEAVDAYLEAVRLAPHWEFPRVRLVSALRMIYGSGEEAAVERIRTKNPSLADDIAKRFSASASHSN